MKVLAVITSSTMPTIAPANYLVFLTPSDIRLKGTRIGIETILYEYLDRGQSPEVIAQTYPALTLEQVYAVILYYFQDLKGVSEYMKTWREHGNAMRERQRQNPPPISEDLRKLRHQQRTNCE